MKELVKNSSAYKIIASDKKAGKLSHAYLVVCQDADMHDEHLKILSKLIMCDSDEFCNDCRICRLIDKNEHPDVTFYPKDGGKLKTDSADDLIAQSIVKPFELNKRLFVLRKIEELNQYQNKLLKTVEEPPKNVHLLISTAKPAAVLSTIKSRSKIVEIGDFPADLLFKSVKELGYGGERLDIALKLCDGKMGRLIKYCSSDDLINIKNLSTDVLVNMNGKNLPEFAGKLKNVSITDFMSVTKLLLSKMLVYLYDKRGEEGYEEVFIATKKWRYGAIIGAIERINKLEKSINYNVNGTILSDSVLFSLMEEKTKWQKL